MRSLYARCQRCRRCSRLASSGCGRATCPRRFAALQVMQVAGPRTGSSGRAVSVGAGAGFANASPLPAERDAKPATAESAVSGRPFQSENSDATAGVGTCRSGACPARRHNPPGIMSSERREWALRMPPRAANRAARPIPRRARRIMLHYAMRRRERLAGQAPRSEEDGRAACERRGASEEGASRVTGRSAGRGVGARRG